jgi:Flp pilus assembly secretin CpaC
MKRKIFTLSAVLALATCLALAQDQPAQNPSGQAQPAPQTQQAPTQHPSTQGQTAMSSEQLQSAFQRTFQQYPELSNVKVNVADDKIELSGTVNSQSDKDKLHRTAEAYAGSRKVVDDKLTVAGNGSQQQKPPMSEQPPMSEKPPASSQPPMSQKPPR